MKKMYVLLLTIFAPFSLMSQIEWVGNFGQSSRTSGLYKTKNNQFIITRETEDDAGFSVVDSFGNMVFNYSDPYSLNPDQSGWTTGGQEIYDFVELADSTCILILSENETECKDGSYSNSHYKLLKYDENWNEIDLSVSTIPIMTALFKQFLAPLPDGGFLLLSEGTDELQKRNGQGELVWTKKVPDYIFGINDFLVVWGDTAVIAKYDGTYLLDGQGNVIETYQNVFDKITPAPNGNLYGILDESLFLLTPKFEVLDNMELPAVIRDFSTSDSILAILTSMNTIYTFDHDFNVLNSLQVDGHYPLEYVETLPHSIVVSGTALYGEAPWGGWFSKAPFLKEVSYNGVFLDNSEDIGIASVEAIGTPTLSISPYGEYQLTYDSLKITVQNYGDNTVESLKLNSYFPSIFISFEPNTVCTFYQYPYRQYNNLSIPSGELRNLYWEDFSIIFAETPEVNFEICVWSSLPNQNIDMDSGNDLFCTDFLVSDKEAFLAGFSWNVFPNPVYDNLNIQLETPLKGCKGCMIRVIDVSGKQRHTSRGRDLLQSIKIPVLGWESGLYFVQYISDEGIISTSRFVVMH